MGRRDLLIVVFRTGRRSATGTVTRPELRQRPIVQSTGTGTGTDFLDINAILASGRYSRERLLDLAAAADDGFDRHMFADALGALTQITDAAFAEYGTPARGIADLRHRFAAWRDDLLAS